MAALVQILILALFGAIVLARPGLALSAIYPFSRVAIWFVAGFFMPGSIYPDARYLQSDSASKKITARTIEMRGSSMAVNRTSMAAAALMALSCFWFMVKLLKE